MPLVTVKTFESFDELRQMVENSEGVLTVRMEQLRDIYGVKRLGINVNSDISKRLGAAGLGHVPELLPLYHQEEVRVFRLGTAIGEMISTALAPSSANDNKLRRMATGSAEETLDKIRALVGTS